MMHFVGQAKACREMRYEIWKRIEAESEVNE
jgi:hypothetical protein